MAVGCEAQRDGARVAVGMLHALGAGDAADAIAGMLILVINIIGGLTIGISQHDLSFSEAGRIYVLLTIGDGLVAQIPSLLLSLATAIVVTRVTTSESMTTQASTQLGNPLALIIAGGIIILLGLKVFIYLSVLKSS